MNSNALKKTSKPKKQPTSKRKILIALILIGFAFSGAFLFYFALQITLNTKHPMVVVVSGSMEPKILKGDLLFLKGEDPANIKNGTIEGKEGDIIVYNARGLWPGAPSDPIVHRVVDKRYDNGYLFLTKGDANPTPDDSWVPETRILGVVVGRIPYIGWVKIILTDTGLLIPLLVIVSGLLIISIIWDLVKKDEKEDKKDMEIKPRPKLRKNEPRNIVDLTKEDNFDLK